MQRKGHQLLSMFGTVKLSDLWAGYFWGLDLNRSNLLLVDIEGSPLELIGTLGMKSEI